jgi:prepilin-type N-terminal cleavage/methylation domain-containing protein
MNGCMIKSGFRIEPRRAIHRGMTVTELLVVIAIIAGMMALLIPAIQWTRERSRMTTCAGNVKQIGQAFTQMANDTGSFPHAGLYDPNDPTPPWSFAETVTLPVPNGTTQPYVAWGWAYQILPYMGRRMEYDQLRMAQFDGTQVELTAAGTRVSEYFCPSRRRPTALDGLGSGMAQGPRGAIDYAGNGGWRNRLVGSQYNTSDFSEYPALLQYPAANSAIRPDGTVIPPGQFDVNGNFVSYKDKPAPGAIEDGAATTILVGERNFNFFRAKESIGLDTEDNGFMAGYTWDTIRWAYDVPYYDRNDPTSHRETRFGSPHKSANGCYFVFADGSVKLLKFNIGLEVFRQLCSRDDGRVTTIP